MDKIEKIRQEIERHRQAIRVLNEHTAPEQTSKTCAIFQYSDTILSELLSFLDSLPEEPDKSLEEAAEEYAGVNYDCETETDAFYHHIQTEAFKAGAERAMKQGVKTTGTISPRGIIYDTNVGYHLFLERYHNGDKVEIQIRKIKENGK